MSKPLIAYCYASGQIEFGLTIPVGAIEIARGTPRAVRRDITATARLAYDSKTLLVPGVPEAANQDQALAALNLHCRWLKRRERPGFTVNTRRPLPKSRAAVRKLVDAVERMA